MKLYFLTIPELKRAIDAVHIAMDRFDEFPCYVCNRFECAETKTLFQEFFELNYFETFATKFEKEFDDNTYYSDKFKIYQFRLLALSMFLSYLESELEYMENVEKVEGYARAKRQKRAYWREINAEVNRTLDYFEEQDLANPKWCASAFICFIMKGSALDEFLKFFNVGIPCAPYTVETAITRMEGRQPLQGEANQLRTFMLIMFAEYTRLKANGK